MTSVGVNSTAGIDASGIRERLPRSPEAPKSPEAPTPTESVQTAQDAVKALNDQEARQGKDEKEQKTFGRTPDGTGACPNVHTPSRWSLYAINVEMIASYNPPNNSRSTCYA